MSYTSPDEWGLPSDITSRFGARLVQEGNWLHYLADKAGLMGSFSPEQLQSLENAFPLFIEQLENMLRSGELNPQQQHQMSIQLTGLTCIADTLSSCDYVYLTVYPAQ